MRSHIYIYLYISAILGLHQWNMRFPGQGSNWSYSCWPTPQSEQCHIWAASVTYTSAHGNTGSLTHWVRLGIEPTTSWFLVGFVSAAPWREFQDPIFFSDEKWLWLKTVFSFNEYMLRTNCLVCYLVFYSHSDKQYSQGEHVILFLDWHK